MTTSGLWNEGYGAVGATLKSLEDAGVTALGLKKIRSNPELASQIATLLAGRERRTKYTYPPKYKPLGIVEQVKALQKVSAFAELDASWALNEAEAWYDSLVLPDWIENPFVYVWHEALGGYHITHDLVFKAIAKERKFHNYREGQLTPERLRQHEATHEAELKLKADQPGGFLIVPSQAGDRWGNYSVKEVRESYDEGEFGLDGIAEGCRVISHPNRLMRFDELDMDCPGAEFDDPDADDRFDHAPYFVFGVGKVRFDTHRVGSASDVYGSASGCLPQ
jgi:hypothetical protein